MLDDKPNEIKSKVNQKEERIVGENTKSFDNYFGDWKELEMLAKRLENRVVEIFKIVRKELEKNWINGVVEM